ncbi:MAG: glutamate--tRNA ligase [Petrotogales bacterium]
MIRCRFAPSPTGHLHVGGVRTALFNWLFTRSNNGKFILRIEDTDVERSTKNYEEQILMSLRWCGLDWDEGPDIKGLDSYYRQSERNEQGIYLHYAKNLVNEGYAYYAIYDPIDRNKIIKKTSTLSKDEYYNHNYTINLKCEKSGEILFNDLLKGEMSFRKDTFNDFVIMKSNGFPTYNFAVVIDDYLMEITHVIRGEDHLSNTPRQLMIYEVLDWKPPEFMHIPLILGHDRSPLSKRHGHTSVEFFRNEGYLSKGLMNYLALLGWTVNEEIFDFKNKINEFSLNSISNKPVIFDYEKLEWINGKQLRIMEIDDLLIEYGNWLKYIGDTDIYSKITENQYYTKNVIEICKPKVNTLTQLYEFSLPFFINEMDFEDRFVEKFIKKEWFIPLLERAIERFDSNNDWSIKGTEKVVRDLAEEKITSKKNTFQSIRGASTGRLVTPGLFETLAIMGRTMVLERLNNALDMAEQIQDDEK